MAQHSRPAGAKPRIKRAEREAQIVEEAERAFAALGFAAVRMEDVAERCGVTKPLLYSYFGSKKGLFAAVLDRLAAGLSDRVIAVAERSGDPEALDAALMDLMMFVQRMGGMERSVPPAVLEERDFADIVRRHQAHVETEMLSIVVRLYPCGLPETKVRGIAAPYVMALLGAAEGGVSWWASNPKVPAEEARRLSRRVLNAMLGLIEEDLIAAGGKRSAEHHQIPINQ